MDYKTINYRTEDRIATISLNRPDRMNAFSLEMPGELKAAVDRANRDAGLWFKQRAEKVGFKQAVTERDSGAPIAEGASRPLSPYPRPD